MPVRVRHDPPISSSLNKRHCVIVDMTNQLFHSAGNVGHGAPHFSYHYNRASDFWSPIQSNEFYLNLSAGFVSGMSAQLIHGRNSDVDAPEDVWQGGGFYAGFPTGEAETITITSTVDDDSLTGIGLRSVSVYGLNQNFISTNEVINLSGTSGATTTGLYKRVWKLYGETAGASGVNIGVLTATHTTTTPNEFSVIPVGLGESQECVFTVPSGYKGYVDGVMGTVFDNTANKSILSLRSQQPGKSVRMKRPFSISTDAPLDSHSEIFMEFEQMTDLSVRVLSTVNTNADITASFVVVLIKQ